MNLSVYRTRSAVCIPFRSRLNSPQIAKTWPTIRRNMKRPKRESENLYDRYRSQKTTQKTTQTISEYIAYYKGVAQKDASCSVQIFSKENVLYCSHFQILSTSMNIMNSQNKRCNACRLAASLRRPPEEFIARTLSANARVLHAFVETHCRATSL